MFPHFLFPQILRSQKILTLSKIRIGTEQKNKIRETPGGVSLTRGNAYNCTDADFSKFASLHAFLQQSVLHSAGCNAFYKVLLCCKEQNHQRHNRNEGHCHNLAPLHDRFRIQGQANRQGNRILLHGVDENQ